jgi:GTP-binding protein Era
LAQRLGAQRHPVVLAINKIDRVDNARVLERIAAWSARLPLRAAVPISARRGTQIAALLGEMEQALPCGPPFFAEDALTDRPERFIAEEIIREKVVRLTGDEIPHAAAVTVTAYDAPQLGGPVTIHATVHVERASQKGIVIGKGGAKLKQIGIQSRRAIERWLGKKVVLKLFVRVQKNWSRDSRALRRFGY